MRTLLNETAKFKLLGIYDDSPVDFVDKKLNSIYYAMSRLKGYA